MRDLIYSRAKQQHFKLINNFSDGKFEQRLNLVRVQKQISNDSKNIPPLTAYNETIEVTNLGPDPNRAPMTSPRPIPRPSNQVTVNGAPEDPDETQITTSSGVGNYPQQAPSSARAPGQNGWGRSGDEFNALDAISEQNRIYRQIE